jgi:hypothetical protein
MKQVPVEGTMAESSLATKEQSEELKGADTLQRARLYLSWGLVPLPIKPEQKSPFGLGWPETHAYDAIDRIKTALAYYGWKQELNVGILCGKRSGILVLDIDVRGRGVERWEAAVKEHGRPSTFTVRTGSGGLHIYFKYEGDAMKIGTSVDSFGVGWDVRAKKGQVLGPFSIHPETGKEYRPVYGLDKVSLRPVFAEMPRWLLDLHSAR